MMAHLSRQAMEQQLLQWNPHWKRTTVESWHDRQLYAVYMRCLEQQRQRQWMQQRTVTKPSTQRAVQLSLFDIIQG